MRGIRRGWALAASALVLFLACLWYLRPVTQHARPVAAPPSLAGTEVTGPAWAERFQDAKDGPAKEKVLREAASDGRPSSVAFVAGVAASDDRLAKAAASALGDVTSPTARPTLRETAGAASVLAAANAIRALGNIGDPGDLDLLTRIAEERRGTRLWHEAVRAMGHVRSDDARRLLEAWLPRGGDEQERLSVLSGLKDAARPESIPALEGFLAAGPSESERVFAKSAIDACRKGRPTVPGGGR